MEDVVPTFPLFWLPKDAIRNTLRIMNHLEIFGISTLSKKLKNLVESSKLTAMATSVFVNDLFEIYVDFRNENWLYFELYEVEENKPIQEVETPENVYITTENATAIWTNSLSVKQMLNHLQFIFHGSTNVLYFGLHCERFGFESIQKSVKDFEEIFLTSGNHEQNRRVLNFSQPAALGLLDAALDDGHVPRYVSIQNLDRISVHNEQVFLDDLLVTNTRSISLIRDILSMKTLNRFLKLWVKGSNTRLEYVFIQFRRADFQKEELLRGLKYQHVQPNKMRFFKVCGKKEPKKTMGGWDIWRLDGTQATITVIIGGNFAHFNLLVWHDHCVVN